MNNFLTPLRRLLSARFIACRPIWLHIVPLSRAARSHTNFNLRVCSAATYLQSAAVSSRR